MKEIMMMKVNLENYKGIEFIRISSLPDDQKNLIGNSLNPQKIIKIMRDTELLNDCVRYSDYVDWYDGQDGTLDGKSELAKKFKVSF